MSGSGGTSVLLKVYDVKIAVTDFLGLAVGGASVTLLLDNGSSVVEQTGADGVKNVGLVPLGTYQATVSYLGLQTGVSGDASSQTQAHVDVPVSYPVLGILLISISLVILVVFVLRRRSEGEPKLPIGQGMVGGQLVPPRVDADVFSSEWVLQAGVVRLDYVLLKQK